MKIFIILAMILIFIINGFIANYLVMKIIKHHKLALKDTAIYPIIIGLTAITLAFAVFNYTDTNGLDGIVYSLKKALDIAKFSLETDLVKMLIHYNDAASKFIMVTYLTLYGISGLAFLSISISLLFVVLTNYRMIVSTIMHYKNVKEIDYIFGFNSDTKEYIKNLSSIKHIKKKLKNYSDDSKEELQQKLLELTTTRTYQILDNSSLDKHDDERFYLNKFGVGYLYRPYGFEIDFYNTFKKLIRGNKRKRFIAFFDEDKKNYEFVNSAIKLIKELKEDYMKLDIEFIVVASIEQERFLNNMIYSNINDNVKEFVDHGKGKIRIFNKYDLISYEFIKNHNFAKYINKNLVSNDLSINDSDINLYMLGFGKVNQTLLRDILICNQFVEKDIVDGNIALKPKRINVKVFDSKPKIECFELINGFLKYDLNNYSLNKEYKDKYLDLPEDYKSHIEFRAQSSIYSDDFVKKLFDEINTNCSKRNQINFFVISIDSDFVNSDIAVKLRDNFNHIESNNFKAYNYFFVRMKESKYNVKENIIGFGSNIDVINYKNVVGNHIVDLAKSFNKEYNDFLDGNNTYDKNEGWAHLPAIKKKSNYYSVLSVYFKLNMINLLSKINNNYSLDSLKNVVLENYKFKKINRIPDYIKGSEDEFYLKEIDEKGNFDLRDVLSFMEHEKWNAFELSQGVLPMSKYYSKEKSLETINSKKTKIIKTTNDEYYHLAITSNKGLYDYYYFISSLKDEINKKCGMDVIDDAYADVIVYDYIHMDMIYNDLISDNKLDALYQEVIKYLNNKN